MLETVPCLVVSSTRQKGGCENDAQFNGSYRWLVQLLELMPIKSESVEVVEVKSRPRVEDATVI